jgi:hypothetical protein
MNFFRRLTGLVTVLLSAIGAIGCIAVAVGVWVVYQGVAERVQRVSDKLDVALKQVATATDTVQRVLGKARADLAQVTKESGNLDAGGDKSKLAARTVRALLREQTEPTLDELGGRLATMADAAVVVSSLLQSLEDLPVAQQFGLDPEQLKQRANDAQRLSGILRRLEGAIGDGDKEGARQVAAAARDVNAVLEDCSAAVGNWQSELSTARARLAQVKADVLGWMIYAAIGLSVLALWMAAGQVCLLSRGLRWCRSSDDL